jgi:hypothetical protein
MRSSSVLAPALAAAILASGLATLVATTDAPAATEAATFRSLPVKTQVLIADRHGITAIGRTNAVRNRFREIQTYDVSALSLASRNSTQCQTTSGCTPSAGVEVSGLLAGAQGSLFAPLPLPDGATITSLRLRFRDNDGARDVSARILRRAAGGAYAPTSGLSTVGTVTSSGASNTLRLATATIRSGGAVSTRASTLYVEVFVPPSSELQVASVQVHYKPKAQTFPKLKLP